MPNELLAVSFKADGHADRHYRSCPLRAVDVTVSEEIANMCLKHVFFEGKREKMEHRVSNGCGWTSKRCAVQYLQLFASRRSLAQSDFNQMLFGLKEGKQRLSQKVVNR